MEAERLLVLIEQVHHSIQLMSEAGGASAVIAGWFDRLDALKIGLEPDVQARLLEELQARYSTGAEL